MSEENNTADPQKFPLLSEVDRILENALKELFQENYKTGVIKYKKGLYLVLPPEFFHFPPAIISYESHPDDDRRVLYILISLRIPIPCDALQDALMTLKNVILFGVEKVTLNSTTTEQCYINIGNRLHSISIRDDPEWFLMMLSSILKAPLLIYPNIRGTEETQKVIKEKEQKGTKETEETYIW